MDNVKEMRTERTTAKRAVTVASRRLSSAVQLSMDSVEEMAAKLDSVYCDYVGVATEYAELCKDTPDITDEFLIVNSLNLKEYDEDVFKTYEKSKLEFKSYISKCKSKSPESQKSNTPSEKSIHLKKEKSQNFRGGGKIGQSSKLYGKRLLSRHFQIKLH